MSTKPDASSEPQVIAPADAAVTVIIVNYRTPGLTRDCLRSLEGERRYVPRLKVVVVDGGSADGSAEELAAALAAPEYRDWTSFLPLTTNGGFGWANNQAILLLARSADPPEFVHLLNPDAYVQDGALPALIAELMANPQAGAAGSQLLSVNATAVPSSFRFPSTGRELVAAAESEKLAKLLGIDALVVPADESVEVDWVTGASVMLRASALRECGLFDDGFFLYFDEVELMHRLREHGWRVRHVPESRVVHVEGASTGIRAGTRRPSLPRYWYNSRRRYFALTGGRTSVILANFAFALGRAVNLIKAQPVSHSAARVADLLRFNPWPGRTDVCPSAPAWGDEPGKMPFWMSIG